MNFAVLASRSSRGGRRQGSVCMQGSRASGRAAGTNLRSRQLDNGVRLATRSPRQAGTPVSSVCDRPISTAQKPSNKCDLQHIPRNPAPFSRCPGAFPCKTFGTHFCCSGVYLVELNQMSWSCHSADGTASRKLAGAPLEMVVSVCQAFFC